MHIALAFALKMRGRCFRNPRKIDLHFVNSKFKSWFHHIPPIYTAHSTVTMPDIALKNQASSSQWTDDLSRLISSPSTWSSTRQNRSSTPPSWLEKSRHSDTMMRQERLLRVVVLGLLDRPRELLGRWVWRTVGVLYGWVERGVGSCTFHSHLAISAYLPVA
jgi:hypothetical protein